MRLNDGLMKKPGGSVFVFFIPPTASPSQKRFAVEARPLLTASPSYPSLRPSQTMRARPQELGRGRVPLGGGGRRGPVLGRRPLGALGGGAGGHSAPNAAVL